MERGVSGQEPPLWAHGQVHGRAALATFGSFWGKARPAGGAGPRWHPLWMHSLDVAAVGSLLAGRHSLVFPRIAVSLGWQPGDFLKLWTFLLALHDLGKFSRLFQAKAPEFWPEGLLGPLDAETRQTRDPGHPQTGLALLLDSERLAPAVSAWFPGWPGAVYGGLLETVLGHHGRPLEERPLLRTAVGQAERAAADFVRALEALLTPPALPPPDRRRLRKASWSLEIGRAHV